MRVRDFAVILWAYGSVDIADPMSAASSEAAASAGQVDRDGRCDLEKANIVNGKPYTEELAQQARRLAGAAAVRRLGPGGAPTMEYRPDRLNLSTDQGGIIYKLSCG